GADDRPHLHLVDLRILEPEAAAARPEHRIRLLEGPNPRPHPVVFRLLERRQKLMEWWIEQPDGHGQTGHGLEDPFEVALLVRQQPLERGAPLVLVRGHDHLPYDREPVL